MRTEAGNALESDRVARETPWVFQPYSDRLSVDDAIESLTNAAGIAKLFVEWNRSESIPMIATRQR